MSEMTKKDGDKFVAYLNKLKEYEDALSRDLSDALYEESLETPNRKKDQ